MKFYIYENWQAHSHGRSRIHRGDCAWCNDGKGPDNGDYEGKHGEWHGPFDTFTEAHGEQEGSSAKDKKNCGHCCPDKPNWK